MIWFLILASTTFILLKLLSFKNSKAWSKESLVWSFDNFKIILFLSSKSHLLDGKKYKFLISPNENLEFSIVFVNSINSSIVGFPNINGNSLSENFTSDNFPFDPIRNIFPLLLILAKKVVFSIFILSD